MKPRVAHMTSGDSYDFRRAQQTGSLHTDIVTLNANSRERPCKVCHGPMSGCISGRRREFGLEVAHAGCGWFGTIDNSIPREVRRPGTDFAFWEWPCIACGLDAASTKLPLGGEDRRCKRCRSGIQIGSIVKPRMGAIGWSSTMSRTTRFARHRIPSQIVPAYSLDDFAFERARVTMIAQAGMISDESEHRIPIMTYAAILFLEGAAVRHQVMTDIADLVLG